MDILAHGLWAGIGVAIARRRCSVTRRLAVATVALAVLPDIVQTIPLLGWIVAGDGTVGGLIAYALASPGTEPPMPGPVALLTHHLHCLTHSAIVALPATIIGCALTRRAWLPALGWWSHILIDVFTHSDDFYPSPVLYPITYRGFDGIGWNEPWFLALNYASLVVAGAALYLSRRHPDRLASTKGTQRP